MRTALYLRVSTSYQKLALQADSLRHYKADYLGSSHGSDVAFQLGWLVVLAACALLSTSSDAISPVAVSAALYRPS
jgi:hypothetical protein